MPRIAVVLLLLIGSLFAQDRLLPPRQSRTITQGSITLQYARHYIPIPLSNHLEYCQICLQTTNADTRAFMITVTYQRSGKYHSLASVVQRVMIPGAVTCEVFWGDVAAGLLTVGVQELAAPVEFVLSEP